MLLNLENACLLLRKLTKEDKEAIFNLRTNEIVNKYSIKNNDKTKIDSLNFINQINDGIDHKQWFYWGIILKEQNKLIGTICLWNFSSDNKIAEVGFQLLPAYQKQGYMSEALKIIIAFSWNNLKITVIQAFTSKFNLSSRKLLETNNFLFVNDPILFLLPEEEQLKMIMYQLNK